MDEGVTRTSDLQRQLTEAGVKFSIYPQFDSNKHDNQLYPPFSPTEAKDTYGLKQTKSQTYDTSQILGLLD